VAALRHLQQPQPRVAGRLPAGRLPQKAPPAAVVADVVAVAEEAAVDVVAARQ
jgi:hypothetical protein